MASLPQDIAMEGVLSKQGHSIRKDWKRRYFRLRNDKLLYGKTREDVDAGRLLGTLDFAQVGDVRLSRITEVSGLTKHDLGLAFQISLGSGERVYYLRATSKPESKQWMTMLLRAKRTFSGASGADAGASAAAGAGAGAVASDADGTAAAVPPDGAAAAGDGAAGEIGEAGAAPTTSIQVTVNAMRRAKLLADRRRSTASIVRRRSSLEAADGSDAAAAAGAVAAEAAAEAAAANGTDDAAPSTPIDDTAAAAATVPPSQSSSVLDSPADEAAPAEAPSDAPSAPPSGSVDFDMVEAGDLDGATASLETAVSRLAGATRAALSFSSDLRARSASVSSDAAASATGDDQAARRARLAEQRRQEREDRIRREIERRKQLKLDSPEFRDRSFSSLFQRASLPTADAATAAALEKLRRSLPPEGSNGEAAPSPSPPSPEPPAGVDAATPQHPRRGSRVFATDAADMDELQSALREVDAGRTSPSRPTDVPVVSDTSLGAPDEGASAARDEPTVVAVPHAVEAVATVSATASVEPAAVVDASAAAPVVDTPQDTSADVVDTAATGSDAFPDVPAASGDAFPDVPAAAADSFPDVPAATTDSFPDIPAAAADSFPDVPTAAADSFPDVPAATFPDVPAITTAAAAFPDAPSAFPDAPSAFPDAPSALPDAPSAFPDAPVAPAVVPAAAPTHSARPPAAPHGPLVAPGTAVARVSTFGALLDGEPPSPELRARTPSQVVADYARSAPVPPSFGSDSAQRSRTSSFAPTASTMLFPNVPALASHQASIFSVRDLVDSYHHHGAAASDSAAFDPSMLPAPRRASSSSRVDSFSAPADASAVSAPEVVVVEPTSSGAASSFATELAAATALRTGASGSLLASDDNTSASVMTDDDNASTFTGVSVSSLRVTTRVVLAEVSKYALRLSKALAMCSDGSMRIVLDACEQLVASLFAAIAHRFGVRPDCLWEELLAAAALPETHADLVAIVQVVRDSSFEPVPHRFRTLLNMACAITLALQRRVLEPLLALLLASPNVPEWRASLEFRDALLASAAPVLQLPRLPLVPLGTRRMLRAVSTACSAIAQSARADALVESASRQAADASAQDGSGLTEFGPVAPIRDAIERITDHYNESLMEGREAGSDEEDLVLRDLVRGQLCAGIASLLSIGFRAQDKLIGHFTLWDYLVGAQRFASKQSSIEFAGFSRAVQHVHHLDALRFSDDVRLRAFVCHALNNQTLRTWLSVALSIESNNKKFFSPASFVRTAAARDAFLAALGPLSALEFQLRVDLEGQARPSRLLPLPRVRSLRLPKVSLPKVSLPRVSLPKVTLPKVTLPRRRTASSGLGSPLSSSPPVAGDAASSLASAAAASSSSLASSTS